MEDIRRRDCGNIFIKHLQERLFSILLGMVELNLRNIYQTVQAMGKGTSANYPLIRTARS